MNPGELVPLKLLIRGFGEYGMTVTPSAVQQTSPAILSAGSAFDELPADR